jgi:hypothetical protein
MAGGIAGVCSRGLETTHGRVARLDDRFERLALVLHVALRGLDQVGNQVVAACELHVDLGERVLVAVARADQPVVEGDDEPDHEDDDGKQNPTTHDGPP